MAVNDSKTWLTPWALPASDWAAGSSDAAEAPRIVMLSRVAATTAGCQPTPTVTTVTRLAAARAMILRFARLAGEWVLIWRDMAGV